MSAINNEHIQQRLLSERESSTLARAIEISQAMESAAQKFICNSEFSEKAKC